MARFNDSDDPRRRQLLQLLATGLLAGVPPVATLAGPFGNVPRQLQPGRSIFSLRGTVRVNGAAATADTRIGPADVVETGADGEIVFVVGKDSYLLRANSKLVLTPETTKQGLAESLVGHMRLVAGRVLSVFAKRRHTIETSTVVIGVRGTGVYLEADPDETYLCTCYGLVDIRSVNDPGSRERIAATHHDKPRYIAAAGGEGKRIRPAPMKNHTDQELMLIEEIVGRQPPFVFPADDYGGPRREY